MSITFSDAPGSESIKDKEGPSGSAGVGLNIPAELRQFFLMEDGQTLLIKGLPGTGKTTLAFEIMSDLCRKGNGMYISTRVNPTRVHAVYPWIKDVIPSNNVINATQAKLLHCLEGMDDGYESVLNFFKILFDEAEDMEEPMIVIDSWDAVLNYTAAIIGDGQHSFEQNICEFGRDLGIHLIFVSEFASLMPLDYIVDGVVTMEQFQLNEGSTEGWTRGMRTRNARKIVLEKLRGVAIRQKSYTCTLHGGRFHYFEPYKERQMARIGGDVVRIPDPAERMISTGIKDLDEIIGGLESGTTNVIEIEHGVGRRYYQILTALASNALKNGRGVFILPSIGYTLSQRDIFVPTNVKTFQTFGDDLVEWGREMLAEWDALRERTGRPILNIIGMDSIEFAFGYKELLNLSNRMVSKWKETNDINVLVVKTGQDIIKMAIHSADTYLVVSELNGGLCLYGAIPRTELFNISTKGQNMITLTPIV